MRSVLTHNQCIQLLQSETVGRIGYTKENNVYIVPISYVLDDKYIYAQSPEGAKLQFMRKNKNVCFQVERIENMINWRSVVVQGTFEELKTEKNIVYASELLSERLEPFAHRQVTKIASRTKETATLEKRLRTVFFRIKLLEISGRYEKSE